MILTRRDRNDRALRALHPGLVARARDLLAQAERARDLEPEISSGRRTFVEQQRWYLSGAPEAAAPGHSWHELGLALDVDLPGAGTCPDLEAARAWLAAEAAALGLVDDGAGRPGHLAWHPGWGPRGAHLARRLAGADLRLADDFFDDPPDPGGGGLSVPDRRIMEC